MLQRRECRSDSCNHPAVPACWLSTNNVDQTGRVYGSKRIDIRTVLSESEWRISATVPVSTPCRGVGMSQCGGDRSSRRIALVTDPVRKQSRNGEPDRMCVHEPCVDKRLKNYRSTPEGRFLTFLTLRHLLFSWKDQNPSNLRMTRPALTQSLSFSTALLEIS